MSTKRLASARNPALEQRVVDAPDDPAPRLVYGDWLQSVGDPLGDWVARSGDVAYLAKHRAALLGRGAPLLSPGWIGWHHGFIDELRLQPRVDSAVKRLAALLAMPIARFVRRIAIGRLANAEELVDAIVEASPPLLDELLIVDDRASAQWRLDALAELPSLRRLGVFGATIDAPMPQLVELAIALPSTTAPWVASGACENVETLTIDCRTTPAPLDPLLAALPRLRRVRVVGARRDLVEAQLAGRVLDEIDIAEKHDEWIVGRVRAHGRDAVRLVPFAGRHLYNAGTFAVRRQPDLAIPLFEAAITLPDARVGTLAWANAAIAHERAGQLAAAARLAREGLMHAPHEPNLHAILIDALRRDDRLDEALACVPRGIAAIDAQRGKHEGGAGACLVDCLVTLAQAGRHAEVIAVAERLGGLGADRTRAVVALSRLARGEPVGDLTGAGDDPLALHARAAQLAPRDPDQARELLRRLKAQRYSEWHWIERDPILSTLS